MVTEQTPSSNEANPVEQVEETTSANDNIDAGAEYFDRNSTIEPQETGVAESTSTEGEAAKESVTESDRTYSQEEFSKMQSAEQIQKAELEKKVQSQEEKLNTLEKQQQQAQTNNIQNATRQYARDVLYPQLVEQGYAESEALQRAEAQAFSELDQLQRVQKINAREAALEAQQNSIVNDSKRLYTQRLNGQYGVPAEELSTFETPEQMEQYAKLWSKTNQSQQQIQNSYQPLNTSGDTTPDGLATDDQSIVDRYAAGDPNISYQVYEEANKRIWGS